MKSLRKKIKGYSELSDEEISLKRDTRVAFDREVSLNNFRMCRLALMNVVGIWGLCNEFEYSVKENVH
jgi:hypothetical protein